MVRIVCGMAMVAYVLWAAFNVLGVALADGTWTNAKGMYSFFGAVLLVSVVTTILSFSNQHRISEGLSYIVPLALVMFWVFQSLGAPKTTWLGFVWYVCPAAAFSAAVLCRSRSSLSTIALR
jgi:hypothetical protein